VLGRGTTVIAHPDGVLGPYLDSIAKLRELVEEGLVDRILPGHGPVIDQPGPVLDYYLEHRHERLDQVRAALEAGATTAREVVEHVYTDVDETLWGAAELSVQAQLDYLRTP
jgi:glyoxylase-like metal-dependent hydrolase (beta-lactamase superfamily II)